jgi:hypothetical protein
MRDAGKDAQTEASENGVSSNLWAFFQVKSIGADTVGGETDIAIVTRHERFKWIVSITN